MIPSDVVSVDFEFCIKLGRSDVSFITCGMKRFITHILCMHVLMGDIHNITSISDDGFYMRLRSLKNALEGFNKELFQSSWLTITFFFAEEIIDCRS